MKQQQLLDIIKDELIAKSKQTHVQKVVPILGVDIVQNVIVNDLPIYEDQLRDIIYDQSKEKIGEVITKMQYEKKLKQVQDEMEKNIFKEKEKKKKKKKKKILLTAQQQQEQQKKQQELPIMVSLQQNIALLMSNIAQNIAAQVAETVKLKQPKQKNIKIKVQKRPSTPEFDQSLQSSDIQQPIEDLNIKDYNQQKFAQQQIDEQKQKQQINEQKQKLQQLEIQKQKEQQQLLIYRQQQEQEEYQQEQSRLQQLQKQQQIFSQQQQQQQQQQQTVKRNQGLVYQPQTNLQNSNAQQNIQKSNLTNNPSQQKDKISNIGTSKYQNEEFDSEYSEDLAPELESQTVQTKQSQMQNIEQQKASKMISSDNYSDDFAEESNDVFNKNSSNFFKSQVKRDSQQMKQSNYPPPPEQIDFADDIEDLLI